ncbi:MAG: HlyD family efflux transporter periplasmic adaptor subunit [Planctomycetes bacterium]|nr:HlyD family efflux transporter periplasmic adaptor subunit [Planctomycetota bacterium]
MSTSHPSNPSPTPESGAIDEGAVHRAKQEIQGLVQEVVELSRSEIEPSEFYAAMLDKSVAALAAVGGVVWTQEEGAPLGLEYQVNLRETGLAESEEAQMQHGRLLQQVIAKGEPVLIPPHSGFGEGATDEEAANPTDFLLVLAPIKSDRGVDGLVEIFQRSGARPTTQRGYLRFLSQICELAGEYLKTRRLRHFATKQTLWEQLEAFTGLVHHALDSRETAYTIANEGRRLVGCDRVTVVLRKGSKYQVAAISGQDTFDKRSNVVRLLRKLATTVSRTGEDLWFEGDTSDLAPQLEKAVNDYVDESHTKRLAVLPLREEEHEADEKMGDKKEKRRENILGAIIIEQLVDSRQPEGMLQRIDVVRRHSSTALTNAQEHESLFLMPLWRLLGKTQVLVTARNLPKTLLALIALAGAISALCIVQYDFTVVADGKLLPEVRRDVFAHLDGMVEEVTVSHGELVKKDQVLARQRSLDLETQIQQLLGQIAETEKDIHSTESRRQMLDYGQADEVEIEELTGRKAQLLETARSLGKQRDLLEEKREKLLILSPIDGKVVTWKVRELIENRPVRKGQRLMEIADSSNRWELEIYVPEAKMGHIIEYLQKLREDDPEAQLEVTFILATHSAVHLEGRIEHIDTSAEVQGESGNTVRMKVSFQQEDLKKLVDDPATELKVGADVKVKVQCGQRAVGYVLFSDLFEFVQAKILFRF